MKEKAAKPTGAGKGDKTRPTNWKKYWANYDAVHKKSNKKPNKP